MDEALRLLGRKQPKTVPMGGGCVLKAENGEKVAVVDLQQLGLDSIGCKSSTLRIGAAATPQVLLKTKGLPPALAKAIGIEGGKDQCPSATVAGTLVAADGCSAFTTAVLAMDAVLVLQPGDEEYPLGELLPLREMLLQGRLISEVQLSLKAALAFESAYNTSADLPLMIVAAARWPSGRTRIVLGGWGRAPMMVVDGKDENDVLPAIENAAMQAADQRGTAEYAPKQQRSCSGAACSHWKNQPVRS